MIKLDTDTMDVDKLVKILNEINKKGMPYAIKQSLDKAAFNTMKYMKENLDKEFIIRNTYVGRSMQYRRVNGKHIDNMESSAGSVLEFMGEQEEGFEKHGTGSTGGVTIPTTAVTNQYGSTRRTKAITQKNQMKAIQLAESQKRNKSTIAKIYAARAQGKKEIFIDKKTDQWKRKTGVYRVIRWRKKKRGWPKGAKLRMIFSLEEKSIRVRPHEWLEPAIKHALPLMHKYFRDAVIEQIQRAIYSANKG